MRRTADRESLKHQIEIRTNGKPQDWVFFLTCRHRGGQLTCVICTTWRAGHRFLVVFIYLRLFFLYFFIFFITQGLGVCKVSRSTEI